MCFQKKEESSNEKFLNQNDDEEFVDDKSHPNTKIINNFCTPKIEKLEKNMHYSLLKELKDSLSRKQINFPTLSFGFPNLYSQIEENKKKLPSSPSTKEIYSLNQFEDDKSVATPDDSSVSSKSLNSIFSEEKNKKDEQEDIKEEYNEIMGGIEFLGAGYNKSKSGKIYKYRPYKFDSNKNCININVTTIIAMQWYGNS